MKKMMAMILGLAAMPMMAAEVPIRVVINDQVAYNATLADNEATASFVERLPLTVTMDELNGNEKYSYLDFSLPTSTYKPGTIHAGDLMLWGNNCLVLFYETFSSSYSYTRLGALDDPSGLADAVGTGDITVRFELVKQSQLGDVNGDGETNISDVTALVDHILGNESQNFDASAADMNGDSEIDIADVTHLVDNILQKS